MVLGAAVIGLLVSFGMDVTVGSFDGSRVVNFGLVAERNSIQTVSGFAAVCAVVLIVFGGRRASTAVDAANRIDCPHCGESILRTAKICKHCHLQIASYDVVAPPSKPDAAPVERPHEREFWATVVVSGGIIALIIGAAIFAR